ncbi:MAG TPA: 30S ribosomal protein S12 methylthiotransferase RimO [Thermoanaerobaculia bacterium]|nr:30S ribosomal protein S12 methylthiotransferase RimO [Thermoanaerobaculia bacterium]HUM28932.1 30S ribosomal protein S12 methylthiotransferase RimO [Thermoanaerobaculia bacterium]HXK67135.1 30S ribosomal protein S12 methylthiotransferase RimO [Thermoanaerobaculia bacterium]
MNASIIHLGCPKNQTLSERLAGMMVSAGVSLSVPEDADIVIVNTCGFINPARQESIDRILESAQLKRSGKLQKLIVTGCMGAEFGSELKAEIPEIDEVFPLDRVKDIVPYLDLKNDPYSVRRCLTTLSHAYLNVAEGCDHQCSFCLIPRLTGPFRSRGLTEILDEAKNLEQAGVSELILVAQDTTAYGKDLGKGRTLLHLLESLLHSCSFRWIRIMYAYPETLDINVVKLMAREPRLVPYLDIPLQHADTSILRRMNRGGSAVHFLKMLERIRTILPDIVLRTTFIVGFPGESDREFETLRLFLEQARFHHAGFFAYDDDAALSSSQLENKVKRSVARRRIRDLAAIQSEISRAYNQDLVDKTLDVLVDEVTTKKVVARHKGQAPDIDGEVTLPAGGELVPGDFVSVKIMSAGPYHLRARPV